MTIKKMTVIAVAGAALLAGALGISMKLTSPNEIEMEVPETPVEQGTENEDGSRTLADMEIFVSSITRKRGLTIILHIKMNFL